MEERNGVPLLIDNLINNVAYVASTQVEINYFITLLSIRFQSAYQPSKQIKNESSLHYGFITSRYHVMEDIKSLNFLAN